MRLWPCRAPQGEFIPPKPKMEEKKEKESFGGPKGNERVARPDEVSRAW